MAPKSKRQRVLKSIDTIPETKILALLKLGEYCSREQLLLQEPIQSAVSLELLLSPLSPDVFLRQCFRQCAVHIPGLNGSERFGPLITHLYDLDPASLFRHTSSDNVFVWLKQANGLIHSVEVPDPETALALYRCGHSTYCRAPPHVEHHLVSALLNDTGLGCGQYDATGQSLTCLGRGEVEVFISTHGHKTEWHCDFQENVTIQLSGTKRWALQRSTLKHPLRGCTPHYSSLDAVEPQVKSAHLSNPEFSFEYPKKHLNAVGEIEEVLVRPGDVLYHPAGIWHKVEVIEPGVSINVSLMASSYADVTCQALKHLLLKETEWRESVASNTATDVIEKLESLLDRLPQIVAQMKHSLGAEAIIPPVLRMGAPIKTDEESDVDENDDDLEAEETDDLIRPSETFIAKHGIPPDAIREKLNSHIVLVSPLGSILRHDELHQFYKEKNLRVGDSDADDGDESAWQHTYVLNINYAGNDAHESYIRRKVFSTGSLLQHLHLLSKERQEHRSALALPDVESLLKEEEDRAMLGYLLHCGYLLWKPKDTDTSR